MVPAGILPISVAESLTRGVGSPPRPPRMAIVITAGMSNWEVVTPKLPRPALRPSAVPCWLLGKKELMLDIEQAKLPPPMPERRAISWNTQRGVCWLWRALPVPKAGIMSRAVGSQTVLRPPHMRMKNDAGMRVVAPDRPAMAAIENSSSGLKGKPALAIWTVMMPHINQTANPHRRLGMDIHRLRLAMPLPFVRQKVSSSGRQSTMSTELVTLGVFWVLLIVIPYGIEFIRDYRQRPGRACRASGRHRGLRSSTSRSAKPRPRRTSA